MWRNNNIDFYKDLFYQNECDYISKHINRNLSQHEINDKKILDFGCGAGDATFYLAKNYSPSGITGIDIGKKNINYCNNKRKEENFQNIEFIREDLNVYVLGENKYDLIWSDTMIEYLQKSLDSIIKDFKKALKPNGILLLSFLKKDLINIFIYYYIVKVLRMSVPQKLMFLFYYLTLPVYCLKKIFAKGFVINHQEVRNKIKYFFVPYVHLIGKKEITGVLNKESIKLIYVRDRIKSDIFTTPHLEVKAIKIEE